MRVFAAVLALTTVACSSNPAPSVAQPAGEAESPPTLHVSATASVKRTPDVAVIELAVETVAGTAGAAGRENATRMDAVLAALQDAGVPESQIRTRRLDLRPQYDQRRDRETREIVAYRAVNQVTVRLDDVEGVGAIVDAAVRAGANRVSGIRFELADSEAAYHEALRQAIAKARAEAGVAAAALGLGLGDPIQVSTGGRRPMPGPSFDRAVAMEVERVETAVQPGEIEVDASVSIVWRLES
jgi:hypothetical protein